MLEAGLIGSRFVHFAAVLSLFGAALFPLYAFDSAGDDAGLRSKLRLILFGAVLLALVSGAGWFVATAGAMAGDAALAYDPDTLNALLHATEFGQLWLVRLVLLLVTFVLLAFWPRARWLFGAVTALVLLSLAGTGHARAAPGAAGLIHIFSDAAHLLAAGTWLGGLWPLGLVIAASLRETRDTAAIAELLRRFSGVGTIAVAILVASGLVQTWFLVGTPTALISSDYGRLLCLKVALFLVMALLAAANRFWLTPKLSRDPTSKEWLVRLRYHVLGEQALGLCVIGLVAILGTLQPAFVQ
jgi:putative copper resistance protein D